MPQGLTNREVGILCLLIVIAMVGYGSIEVYTPPNLSVHGECGQWSDDPSMNQEKADAQCQALYGSICYVCKGWEDHPTSGICEWDSLKSDECRVEPEPEKPPFLWRTFLGMPFWFWIAIVALAVGLFYWRVF